MSSVYDAEAASRSAKHAARLRQITDQLQFDRIAEARDSIVRNMALAAYDDDDAEEFEDLLEAMELAEEALEDYSDDGMGDRKSRRERRAARKRRRAARRAARRARRAQRKADRRARRGLRGRARGRKRRAQRKARRRTYRSARKAARRTYRSEKRQIKARKKERRDRRKAGISQTIQARTAEQAAEVTGEGEIPPDAALARVPFYRKPIVIFGGLAALAIGIVVIGKRTTKGKK